MIAKLILVATAGAICLYIFLRGVQEFYIEAFGTWLLSPLIYIRLSPAPLSDWLVRMCAHFRGFDLLLCSIPVLIFLASLTAGFFAHQKRSVALAVVSSLLMTTIFVVYHSVKHLGFSVVDL